MGLARPHRVAGMFRVDYHKRGGFTRRIGNDGGGGPSFYANGSGVVESQELSVVRVDCWG